MYLRIENKDFSKSGRITDTPANTPVPGHDQQQRPLPAIRINNNGSLVNKENKNSNSRIPVRGKFGVVGGMTTGKVNSGFDSGSLGGQDNDR